VTSIWLLAGSTRYLVLSREWYKGKERERRRENGEGEEDPLFQTHYYFNFNPLTRPLLSIIFFWFKRKLVKIRRIDRVWVKLTSPMSWIATFFSNPKRER